jgi:hypothetical protein
MSDGGLAMAGIVAVAARDVAGASVVNDTMGAG